MRRAWVQAGAPQGVGLGAGLMTDPDCNILRQRHIAEDLLHHGMDEDLAAELAALVLDLDNWMRDGGYLPRRWRRCYDAQDGWD